MNSYKLRIDGLDCANCALELESDLNKIDIINNVSVNFMKEVLNVWKVIMIMLLV